MTTKPLHIAMKLIDSLEIHRPPVMIKPICRKLAIPVSFRPISQDGFSLNYGILKAIVLNPALSKTRLRFTAAHELGHLLLDHKHLKACHGNTREEREANAFAAELLMPTKIIQSIIERGKRYSMNPIPEVLAPQFGVSLTAMEIRLQESLIVGHTGSYKR